MSPTFDDWELTPKQQLGRQLRRLRDDAGIDGKDLAPQLGISADLVSRVELGERWPKPAVVEAWARHTGNADQTAELLAALAELRQLENRLRVDAQDPIVAQKLRTKLLGDKSAISAFAVTDIPFFLQTADYARAQLGDVPGAAEVVAMRVAANDAVGAPGKKFKILLAESALRFTPCDARTMRTQLADLQRLIGKPGVEVGVIGFDRPVPAPLRGAFCIYGDIVVAESFAAAVDFTTKHAQRFTDLMSRLWEGAVHGEEVRRHLTAAANALPAS
jgi:transcriptional regulator with XRE-family HTH domain